MANTEYDNRTRQQIASDVLDEEGGGLLGLFKTTGRYISGDFPRSESRDDPQGRVNRRRKGMELLKQREAEGRKRAARLKKEKERQIAKNEAARKERVRAREQAKIDRQAASVTGRALTATEKAAIADMKRRERLAQADSAKASTGVLRSSANAPKPKPPAKPKVPAKTASTSTKPASKSTPASSGPKWKQYKSVAAAKNANPPSKFYMGSDGKKKLAITKEELGRKKGETLTQAYNRFEGKTSRKASSAASTASSTNKSSTNKSSTNQSERSRRFTSPASGRGRRRVTSKAMGGMMKSKMASKGGAKGGRRPTGMKDGGSLEMTMVGGRKVPAFAADGKGANDLAKKMGGGMMKSKGMAKGGAMKKKGYAMGGSVKKKGMAKGGAMKKKGYAMGGMTKKGMAKGGPVKKKAVSRKPRGVGAALRGYGKAMK
jgi:hypothetical protein